MNDTARDHRWMDVETRALVLRLVMFVGTIALLSWLSTTGTGRRLVVEPMTELSVLVSSAIIRVFGGEATRFGTMLTGPTATLNVADGCNGVVAMILYVAAVIGTESTGVMRLVGLSAGLTIIWMVNLIRIISLYAIEVMAPEYMDFFHLYFWQTLIILVVAAVWYAWASRALRPHAVDSPSLRDGGRPGH